MRQKRKFFLCVVYRYVYLLRNSLLVVLSQCLWYSARHSNKRFQLLNPKTSISLTRKYWLPVRNAFPAAHWYALLRIVEQLLVFGELHMTISWALPPPNVGPWPLLHQIEYPSCPALKDIFVGDWPLGLTRLNRNVFCALLYPEEP